MYMNYLRHSIFLLLVTLLDTHLVANMISTLGLVLKNESRQVNSSNYNVEYGDGIKNKGDKIRMPCTHSTVI